MEELMAVAAIPSQSAGFEQLKWTNYKENRLFFFFSAPGYDSIQSENIKKQLENSLLTPKQYINHKFIYISMCYSIQLLIIHKI